jgi:hypothetical protein
LDEAQQLAITAAHLASGRGEPFNVQLAGKIIF